MDRWYRNFMSFLEVFQLYQDYGCLILKSLVNEVQLDSERILLQFEFKPAKKLIEKSRECHNYKPQPTPRPRGREKANN